MAYYFLGRYSEAVEAGDRALARSPGRSVQMFTHPFLAAAYAEMGQKPGCRRRARDRHASLAVLRCPDLRRTIWHARSARPSARRAEKGRVSLILARRDLSLRRGARRCAEFRLATASISTRKSGPADSRTVAGCRGAAGPRYAGENVGVLVERVGIGDVGARQDDVGRLCPCGLEAGLDILADLLDLRPHVALADDIARPYRRASCPPTMTLVARRPELRRSPKAGERHRRSDHRRFSLMRDG